MGVTVGESADEEIALRVAVQYEERGETFLTKAVGEQSSKQTKSKSTVLNSYSLMFSQNSS